MTRRIPSAKVRRPEDLGGIAITSRLAPSFLLCLTLLLFSFLAAGEARAQSAIPTWQPPKTGLGYDVDLDAGEAQRPGPIRAREVQLRGAQPLYVRLLFSWPDPAGEQGGVPLDTLDPLVDRYRDAGFEVILAPRGSAALSGAVTGTMTQEPEILSRWRAFLRAAAERFKGRVRFYQLEGLSAPGAEAGQARAAAFLIKKGAVELRGADPEALVVTETLPASRLDYLSALLGEDTSAYVDVVALHSETEEDLESIAAKATALLLEKDPSASLWMLGEKLPASSSVSTGVPQSQPDLVAVSEGEPQTQTAPATQATSPAPERGASLIRKAASAFAGGARLVSFDLPPAPDGGP
ncbi:MAG TPA: hypothetical protein VFW45_02475, partial [Candidatus Polarisedimenticolia bacterium]|nr:hypothetical protein [Candidatus Polarisedimenticolia bacterium]